LNSSSHQATALSVFHTYFLSATLLCHTKLQTKFEFGFDPLIIHEVITLGLRKISEIINFPHLIFGTIAFLNQVTNQAQVFFFSSFIFHKDMALGLRKISGIFSFPHFFLFAYRYSFDIWYVHCFAIPSYRSCSTFVSFSDLF
jgi:hypothetical protein